MPIQLTEEEVARSLLGVGPGLGKYWKVQRAFASTDVAHDRAFQKSFNGFYRVRRGASWQAAFFGLLQRSRQERPSFAATLRTLHRDTGRVEASFASKLVATIDPNQPVIDRFVLANLGLRLPSTRLLELRLKGIIDIHESIHCSYATFLGTGPGERLVAAFEQSFPGFPVTPVKMLDLVLWQQRDA